MSTVAVRPARVSDARAIAEVHVKAWQQAYTEYFPLAWLAELDVDTREQRWSAVIGDRASRVSVAEVSGVVIGWASASFGAAEPVELFGIYVLLDFYGSGAGAALLHASVGDAAAYCWLIDGNARAERFYAKHGFARTGETDLRAFGVHDVRIVKMARSDS